MGCLICNAITVFFGCVFNCSKIISCSHINDLVFIKILAGTLMISMGKISRGIMAGEKAGSMAKKHKHQ